MTINKSCGLLLKGEARKAIIKGFNQAADLVRATLGPKGRNIVIERMIGYPLVTKDGATVAKHINFSDRQVNTGAKLCREIAIRTDDLAGDGTTTSIVLAQAMVREGIRLVEAGFNPILLKKGMDKAVQAVTEEIQRLSVPADTYEKILSVAVISAKDNYTGELIAQAMDRVGRDGIIAVRRTHERRTYVEVVNGMKIDKGYLSPYFVGEGEQMTVELENALVLITDNVLVNANQVKRILNWCMWENKHLLIVAKDVKKEALELLLSHKNAGRVKSAAVQNPGYGENRLGLLEDLAVVTGSTFISDTIGLSIDSIEMSMLGRADKISVDRDKTIITGGNSSREAVNERVRQLKVLLTQTSGLQERKMLQERIARLSGGIAVIRVGADTEMAMNELMDRVTDAVNAVKAAAEDGIVPGGGTVFVRAARSLDNCQAGTDDELAGIRLVQKALEEPLRQIIRNACRNEDRVIEMVGLLEPQTGYDVIKDEFVDMIVSGVVDPTKVVITALRSAVGMASILLTAEALVLSGVDLDGLILDSLK